MVVELMIIFAKGNKLKFNLQDTFYLLLYN